MKPTLSVMVGVLLAALSLSAADDNPQAAKPAQTPKAAAPGNAQAANTKEFQAAADAFSAAFAKGDAAAIAEMFAEEGEAVDAQGAAIQGRKALAEHYAARFASGPGDTLAVTVDAVSFLAPGVATETGRTRLLVPESGTEESGNFAAILVKRDNRWLIASLREKTERELSHHDRLKELEWLVGDWVEETEEAVVFTSIAWSDNGNYLLRQFDVRVQGKAAVTGSQRIGWDPLTKQIKSWVFDSEGGYGEGLWMRSGNHWVSKTTGVRPDGHTTTATQVLTYVNKDTLRWKSIDRTLGAEIRHDIDEIIMVRKPPKPQ